MTGATVYVICDGRRHGVDCRSSLTIVGGRYGSAAHLKRARSEARKLGWCHVDGHDYCPDCLEAIRELPSTR